MELALPQPPIEWIEEIERNEDKIKEDFFNNYYDIWEIINKKKKELEEEYIPYYEKMFKIDGFIADCYQFSSDMFWTSLMSQYKKKALLDFLNKIYMVYGINKDMEDCRFKTKTERRKLKVPELREEIMYCMSKSLCYLDESYMKKIFKREFEVEKEGYMIDYPYEKNGYSYKENMTIRMENLEVKLCEEGCLGEMEDVEWF